MVQPANNNSNEIQNLKSNVDIVVVADDLGCLPRCLVGKEIHTIRTGGFIKF